MYFAKLPGVTIKRHFGRAVSSIELSKRQEKILEIVRESGHATGRQIAAKLELSRAALRPDLAILMMAGLLGARPRVGYFLTGKQPSDVVAAVLGNIKVGEVQSRPVVVRDNCSLYDAIVTMFIQNVGTLIIVGEDGCLEGVASRKDMLKATMSGSDLNRMPVGVAMTRMPNIIVTYPQETVERAVQKIINHEVDALPVVEPSAENTGRLKVVGRFSKTNVCRVFAQLTGL